MNRRELEGAIRDEVAEWPGVTVEFTEGGKHPKAKLTYTPPDGGDPLILSRPFPGTPSDSRNGIHKTLGDMRRTMKQLGATRSKPEPSDEEVERRYVKPNDGAAQRPDPVEGEPGPVKDTVADKLVATGLVTPEQAAAAQVRETIVIPDEGQSDEEAAAEAEEARLQALADAIEDGIYFDLDEEVYHRVKRLGGSALTKLCVSAGTFWGESWLNPDPPKLSEQQMESREKTRAIGRAYHCARLEPDRLAERFCREITKADFSRGTAWSGTDIEAALAEAGEPKKRAGEKVIDQARRLEDAGFPHPIFPLEQERWREGLNGRTPIPAEKWDQMTTDVDRIRGHGDIAPLLTGGAAEVSVFYTDRHGLKCKARIDYLRPESWSDFKTFDNSRGKALRQAISDAIRFNRYYVIAVAYRDAVEAIRVGGLQIIGEANGEERALIAAVQIRPVELALWFIFQEKGSSPNLLAREFLFYDVPLSQAAQQTMMEQAGWGDEDMAERLRTLTERRTQIHLKGIAEVAAAKQTFSLYSQVYPEGTPWYPIDALGTVGDEDFNSFWLDGR